MPKPPALITAIKFDLPDGRELLLARFQIDCSACGQIDVTIHGHHLKVIRDMAIDIIDRYPHLCGGEPQKQDTIEYRVGPTSRRPEDN